METESQLGKMRKFWRWSYNSVKVLNAGELYG